MAECATFAAAFARLHDDVARDFFGPRTAIELLSIALLSDGHVLIEDVPGVGKTTLAKSYARALGARFGRVQFTPDLMPQDILGHSVPDAGLQSLRFFPGPIFTEVLLADELNRTPARTQSALLEAMSERQVTVEGETRPLPRPFFVIGTMNPAESLGTYALPESQLDRFALRTSLGWPTRPAMHRLLRDQVRLASPMTSECALPIARVPEAQRLVLELHASDEVLDYACEIGEATRRHPSIELGASPRAILTFVRSAKARALLLGRDYVLPDDLKALAVPSLGHRITVTATGPLAAAGILNEILGQLPVPGARSA